MVVFWKIFWSNVIIRKKCEKVYQVDSSQKGNLSDLLEHWILVHIFQVKLIIEKKQEKFVDRELLLITRSPEYYSQNNLERQIREKI